MAFLAGLIYGIPKGLSYWLGTSYPMAAITSGSMWPALKTGDMVFIEGVSNKDQIRVGDIIVYKNPKGFTIHRVIKIDGESIQTQGDANNIADRPIKFGEVVGKTLNINGKPLRIPMMGNVNILANKSKQL